VSGDLAWARKRRRIRVEQKAASIRQRDRYVDFGVVLRVVRQDHANGRPYLEGKPPLTVLREHRFGGIVDTKAKRKRFVGPSKNPVVWYCSEDQAAIIIHGPDLPDRLLVYGSEGGGKTTAQAMWCALRMLEFTGTGREIGMTAPTNERAGRIMQAIQELWPSSWFRWVDRDHCYYMANGTSVRLVSTHQQSKAEGSRVQGYNWSAAGSDELQDSLDADPDIEMRLRAAPNGRGKRFITATAKDSPTWRTWRDNALAASNDNKPLWHKMTLLGERSPFIWPIVWEEKRQTLTKREYDRRVKAMDVGPERQVYYAWDRSKNLRPRPTGAEITGDVLAKLGGNFAVLVGHDPGTRTRVSLILKAYQIATKRQAGEFRSAPAIGWWVVDEVMSTSGTVEAHALEVRTRLQERWHCNYLDQHGRPAPDAPRAIIHADPYTDSGHDEKRPDRSVYVQFRNAGFTIVPAWMQTVATGSAPAVIPKKARIDMVNGLFCNAAGEHRLFVDCDEKRTPAAPRLVTALETLETDLAGRAEMDRKNDRDQTHAPAALGYALWKLERPKHVDLSQGAA